jgi:predicted KAP-like P-loop ATPase
MWGDLGFEPPNETTWRKQLRICSPDIFPIFFHLALPQGDISNAEIMVILALADKPQEFSARLLELTEQARPDGFTRLHAFLDRVMDYTGKEIAVESIPSIFLSLFDVGDQFIRAEDEGSGKLPVGNDQRVTQIILQLLRRLPWDSRFDALQQAITRGRAVFISAKIVMELGRISDKHAGEAKHQTEALIRHDDQAGLEKLVLDKVRNAAKDKSLLQCPKLPEILALWQNLAGNAEPVTWVNNMVGDDRNLAILLEKFMEKDFSHSIIQVVGDSRYRLNQKALMPFLDPESILDRTRTLTKSEWLGQPQQDALRQFIKDYKPKSR